MALSLEFTLALAIELLCFHCIADTHYIHTYIRVRVMRREDVSIFIHKGAEQGLLSILFPFPSQLSLWILLCTRLLEKKKPTRQPKLIAVRFLAAEGGKRLRVKGTERHPRDRLVTNYLKEKLVIFLLDESAQYILFRNLKLVSYLALRTLRGQLSWMALFSCNVSGDNEIWLRETLVFVFLSGREVSTILYV